MTRDDTKAGGSGSRTESSQQQRVGACGRSSRKVEAENRIYLDREVERERERWEKDGRQGEGSCHTRKEELSRSECGESGGSQLRQQSMSGSGRKESH